MSDPRSASLLEALEALVPVDDDERADVAATMALLRTDHPFEVSLPAHVTASVFCVGAPGVLLHRHRRLGRWLQPGGHVDAGEPPEEAALRELVEETGVTGVHLDPPCLVHVSVHDGPRGHRHFDCRWLVSATATTLSPAAGESPEVAWLSEDEALARCAEDLRVGLRKALGVARDLALPAVASWRT